MKRGSYESRPTVVDLFAGAGLFTYAFEREGFAVVQAIESDKRAAATYAANFGDRIQVADIKRCAPEGRCEVIIAGPPCQGFSTLGKRDSADPRNRLCLDVVRWAEVMKPSIVVIENVAEFLGARVWKLLARRLERLGYEVTADICNGLDYGLPQRRVRSVTFASKVGPITLFKGRTRRHVTVAEAWEGLPRVPNGRGLNVCRTTTPLALARMCLIPAGGDKRDIIRRAPHLAPPSWTRARVEITDVWGRMEWDKPSNTLRTVFVNPSKGRYIHPDQHRVISLREAARLQSIPDEFVFASTVQQTAARQIGNSVPPLMGRSLARQVKRALAY